MNSQHRSFWVRKKVPGFVGDGYENSDNHWKGQESLIAGIMIAQDGLKSNINRGYQECEICGSKLGDGYFDDGSWTWSVNLLHHILHHNLKANEEFIQYISFKYWIKDMT